MKPHENLLRVVSACVVTLTCVVALAVVTGVGLQPEDAAAQTATAPPDRYVVDPSHTAVQFAVRHLGLSKVRGSFSGVSGAVLYDPDRPERSSVTVLIDVASMGTGNERRDEDLRETFFDAERFPRITFQSTRFERTEDGHVLHGLLGIRDSLRSVSLPVEFLGSLTDEASGERRIGFEGEFTIDRKDYGVAAENHPAEIRLVIGHQVEIELQVEALIPGYRTASYRSEAGRSIGEELEGVLEASGAEAARSRYDEVTASPEGFDVSTRELALLGFKRLEAGDLDGAGLAFELYAEADPSASADEWLGHAYAAAGRGADAIAAYERAIAADPWRPSAVEMLRQLRGSTDEASLPPPAAPSD